MSDLPDKAVLVAQVLKLAQTLSTETALFQQAAAARLQLSLTDTKTLALLLAAGPLTAGQLAERLRLTTGAVTSVIDRLGRAGFVRRVAHPTDRRKVVVEPVTEKMQQAEQVYASMAQAAGVLYHNLAEAQLAFLVHHYQNSIALAQTETAKLTE